MSFRVFWDFIALMMQAVRTSETPVHFYMTTRRYIPEDSKLQQNNSALRKLHTLSASWSGF
jgi:hypothetical protein